MSIKKLFCSPSLACLLAASCLAAAGCDSSSSKTGNDGSMQVVGGTGGHNNSVGGTNGGPNGSGGGGYDGPTLGVDAGITKIPLGSTQCSDGIDNDGDGLIDYEDPECVGPLDNDESSFATGIPGDNVDACKQDCFFDGNSGMGDDHCLWQLKCDPKSKEASCPYDPSYAANHQSECSVASSQSQACIDFCQRLVPNGCDCFGCCVVPQAPNPIRLAATCTADKFNDPVACPPCTQVTQCANPCDHCEICIGKPTLPADCGEPPSDGGTTYPPDAAMDAIPDGYTPPPPPPKCASGWLACGPGGVAPTACPNGTGCVTGCCIPIIP